MVAGDKSTTKMVKATVIRDIAITRGKDTTTHRPGEVVELTEQEAAEFCDKPIQGLPTFSGERYEADGQVGFEKIFRAKRIGS